MGSATPASSKNIQRLRAQIASWRRERHARAPLPEHLWANAVEVAGYVGLNQARLALGLSYDGLRAHGAGRAAGEHGDDAQFVELTGAEVLAAAGPLATSGASIEISGRDVHVVVRFGGNHAIDIDAIVDAVRGRQ